MILTYKMIYTHEGSKLYKTTDQSLSISGFTYTYSLYLMFLVDFVSFQQSLFSKLNQAYKKIYN